MKNYVIILIIIISINNLFSENLKTSLSGADKNFSQGTPVTRTFTGTIRYKDNVNNYHPVRYGLVKIIDYDTQTILDSTYTNSLGVFSKDILTSASFSLLQIYGTGKYTPENKDICVNYDSLGV